MFLYHGDSHSVDRGNGVVESIASTLLNIYFSSFQVMIRLLPLFDSSMSSSPNSVFEFRNRLGEGFGSKGAFIA